jgi:ankyrin repeat protein
MQDGDTFLIRANSNRTEEIALVYLAHIIKYRRLPRFFKWLCGIEKCERRLNSQYLPWDFTALHEAVRRNSPEMIEMLLKAGADVSIRDRWGRSPLSYACNEDVANTLLEHVESVKSAAAALAYLNEEDVYGRTLLHRIIHERNNRMICFLVGSGADCSDTDMNIQDQIGETPLSYAVQFGQIEAVQRLLEVGASLDIPDSLGMNPIHIAAHRGKLETLHLLFKHGANVEQIGFGGSTPLFYAIMGDHHGLAKILLEEYSANAFTTATGSGKGSLLHIAAHLACAWAVDMLVNAGLDVNTTDAYGKTPLKYAVENDHIMVVIRLILRGAKLYEKTRRWEETGSPNSTNHLATGLPNSTNHSATGLPNSTNHLATEVVKTVEPYGWSRAVQMSTTMSLIRLVYKRAHHVSQVMQEKKKAFAFLENLETGIIDQILQDPILDSSLDKIDTADIMAGILRESTEEHNATGRRVSMNDVEILTRLTIYRPWMN